MKQDVVEEELPPNLTARQKKHREDHSIASPMSNASSVSHRLRKLTHIFHKTNSGDSSNRRKRSKSKTPKEDRGRAEEPKEGLPPKPKSRSRSRARKSKKVSKDPLEEAVEKGSELARLAELREAAEASALRDSFELRPFTKNKEKSEAANAQKDTYELKTAKRSEEEQDSSTDASSRRMGDTSYEEEKPVVKPAHAAMPILPAHAAMPVLPAPNAHQELDEQTQTSFTTAGYLSAPGRLQKPKKPLYYKRTLPSTKEEAVEEVPVVPAVVEEEPAPPILPAKQKPFIGLEAAMEESVFGDVPDPRSMSPRSGRSPRSRQKTSPRNRALFDAEAGVLSDEEDSNNRKFFSCCPDQIEDTFRSIFKEEVLPNCRALEPSKQCAQDIAINLILGRDCCDGVGARQSARCGEKNMPRCADDEATEAGTFANHFFFVKVPKTDDRFENFTVLTGDDDGLLAMDEVASRDDVKPTRQLNPISERETVTSGDSITRKSTMPTAEPEADSVAKLTEEVKSMQPPIAEGPTTTKVKVKQSPIAGVLKPAETNSKQLPTATKSSKKKSDDEEFSAVEYVMHPSLLHSMHGGSSTLMHGGSSRSGSAKSGSNHSGSIKSVTLDGSMILMNPAIQDPPRVDPVSKKKASSEAEPEKESVDQGAIKQESTKEPKRSKKDAKGSKKDTKGSKKDAKDSRAGAETNVPAKDVSKQDGKKPPIAPKSVSPKHTAKSKKSWASKTFLSHDTSKKSSAASSKKSEASKSLSSKQSSKRLVPSKSSLKKSSKEQVTPVDLMADAVLDQEEMTDSEMPSEYTETGMLILKHQRTLSGLSNDQNTYITGDSAVVVETVGVYSVDESASAAGSKGSGRSIKETVTGTSHKGFVTEDSMESESSKQKQPQSDSPILEVPQGESPKQETTERENSEQEVSNSQIPKQEVSKSESSKQDKSKSEVEDEFRDEQPGYYLCRERSGATEETPRTQNRYGPNSDARLLLDSSDEASHPSLVSRRSGQPSIKSCLQTNKSGLSRSHKQVGFDISSRGDDSQSRASSSKEDSVATMLKEVRGNAQYDLQLSRSEAMKREMEVLRYKRRHFKNLRQGRGSDEIEKARLREEAGGDDIKEVETYDILDRGFASKSSFDSIASERSLDTMLKDALKRADRTIDFVLINRE